MPSRPSSLNWNDVQTVIATGAIVATLGLWNLFATPTRQVTMKADEPALPPIEPPALEESAPISSMPQVKIIFAQANPQIVTAQQPQPEIKKKKKKSNNNSVGQSVTQTKSS